jgi:hypothetical protein
MKSVLTVLAAMGLLGLIYGGGVTALKAHSHGAAIALLD